MIANNSFVERSSNFLFKPLHLADGAFGESYYSTNGKTAVIYGLSANTLYLSQAIVSITAIPFQILAGTFSCLYQCSKNKYKEGFNELANGFLTSGKHALAVTIIPFASIGLALLIIIGLPYHIYTWNTYSKWWDPSEEVKNDPVIEW